MKLNIPVFLSGQSQLLKDEVTESQGIRIQRERIKSYVCFFLKD